MQRLRSGGAMLAVAFWRTSPRHKVYTMNLPKDIAERRMRVELAKRGNSAAVRVPAGALADAGMQIGQALNIRAEEIGRAHV